jgi:hypothetical protein
METKTERNTMTIYIDEIKEYCNNPVSFLNGQILKYYPFRYNENGNAIYISDEGYNHSRHVPNFINVLEWWGKKWTNFYSYKKNLTMDGDELPAGPVGKYIYFIEKPGNHILKRQYVSYTFVNSDNIMKIDLFFPSMFRPDASNGVIVIKDYPIIIQDSLILSSDFTDDLKIEMSNFSIEKQIEIIRDINDQKHRKIESQEQRIREQESQITLMQSVIYSMQNQVQEQSKLIASLQQQQQVDLLRLEREVQEQRNKDQMTSMQNQLREQCKLIASLQSHLVVNKKEESKVEVDMFADWLND